MIADKKEISKTVGQYIAKCSSKVDIAPKLTAYRIF